MLRTHKENIKILVYSGEVRHTSDAADTGLEGRADSGQTREIHYVERRPYLYVDTCRVRNCSCSLFASVYPPMAET